MPAASRSDYGPWYGHESIVEMVPMKGPQDEDGWCIVSVPTQSYLAFRERLRSEPDFSSAGDVVAAGFTPSPPANVMVPSRPWWTFAERRSPAART